MRPFFVYEASFSSDPIGCELQALTHVSWWRGLAAIATNWSIILLVIAFAGRLDHPWAYLTAIVIVGARQHALLIMMHDAAHFRLFPNRHWNELLSDWLCAFPHLISTDDYRRDHLRHHRYLNSDQDPNWVTKIENGEWQFPKTRGEIARILLNDLGGGSLWRKFGSVSRYHRKLTNLAKSIKSDTPRATSRRSRFCYFVLAIALITALNLWWYAIVLWFVPLFTVLPAILRLRVISEHYGLEHTNDMTHSRNYHANFLERFFLAPHSVWLHLDHHLFPSIPHYNLMRAHNLLESIPEYRETAHQSRSIFVPFRKSVLDEITMRR